MHEETGIQIKILIVDDDEVIADILLELLSEKERSVDVCYNGLDAIENIQKNSYDLIIVDLVMPKMGGMDVLKYAKKANPDTIVIILTGYASLETAILAIKAGAHDYITKPFKLEEIKISVENAIGTIKLYRENRELLKKLQDAYHELMLLKKDSGKKIANNRKKDNEKKVANINFFPSNMPSLQYMYDNSSLDSHVDKLEALSSLKKNGMLTESEFKKFKSNLLEMINLKNE